MASSLVEIDEKDILDPQDLEALYSWIDGAPLSRPKKHIARDFSDGVSVAEIVHFYLPRLVELHNYVNANSTAQKRINWAMLNRKVFVKLNLKLSDKIIENVIEAKPGAIEQVLWDLRKKAVEVNPKSLSRSNTSNQLKKGSSGYSEGKLGKKFPSASGVNSGSLSTRTPMKSSQIPANTGRRTSVSPSRAATTVKGYEKPSAGVSYSAGLKDELIQYGNNVNSSKSKPEPTSEGETQGHGSGVVDANANTNQQDPSSLPPSHLIYKGHKMVPSIVPVDIKNRQIRDLEGIVNGLQKKVNFLDNLIQLKDNRVEDLTRQLHGLKSKFQDLTQAKIPDL